MKKIGCVLETLFFIFCIISCSKDLPNKNLVLNKSIERLNDLSYLSSVVSNITLYKNSTFMSDCLNKRIICIDSNYQVIRTFGIAGRGPGEFLTPDQFEIVNDSLYVYDQGTKKILVFTIDGRFCREFFFKNYPVIYTRFSMNKDGDIFISTPLFEYPITVFDRNGNIKYALGAKQDDKQENWKRMAELRHLLFYKNKFLISIIISRAEIEIYDIESKHFKKIDLSHLDILKDLLNYFKGEKRQGGTPTVFSDASLNQNDLFLLTSSFVNGSGYTDKIVKCNLIHENVYPVATFTLVPRRGEKGMYMYIGAKSNEIICFNQSNRSLDIFQF